MTLLDSPYARLMRLHQPTGIYLLLWPALWAITLAEGPRSLMLLFAVGAVVMRGAGCVINDLWDRDLDGHVARTRTRPLASGELTPRQALLFLSLLLLIGMGILLSLPGVTILLGLTAMGLVIAYPLMKRVTWWPQAFLGVTFNMGVPMGYSAVTGTLDAVALTLYASAIFWTLGYDTIYALQDRADDAVIGIKSTARRFGAQVKPMVGLMYALCALLLGLALWLDGVRFYGWLGWLVFTLHLLWQWKTLRPDDGANSMQRFRSNRLSGGILWFFLMADILILAALQ